jgi:NADPH:quinone reductase-like Zn-dependent oxidoreductase
MKAAVVRRFGPPDVLKIESVPLPALDPHEVLIEMHSAGVGIWDAKLRSGEWAEDDDQLPLIPGTDGAGTVAAVGSRVRRFGVGQEVWAYAFRNPKGGFHAEYVAIAEDLVGRVPERLDLAHAGAAAVTGLTALQGIDDALRVGTEETVLIFGASGAVGTLAVQLARRLLARVIATASARDAEPLLRDLGASGVFDARHKDGPAQLAKLIAPRPLDAVLALAGGDDLERCLNLVRVGGRVAYPNGVEPEPRRRPNFEVTAYDAKGGTEQFERLTKAVNAAHLKVPIAATYPLTQAAEAHARIEKGHVLGRVVLRVR